MSYSFNFCDSYLIHQGRSNMIMVDSLSRFSDFLNPEELKLPSSTTSLEDDLKVRKQTWLQFNFQYILVLLYNFSRTFFAYLRPSSTILIEFSIQAKLQFIKEITCVIYVISSLRYDIWGFPGFIKLCHILMTRVCLSIISLFWIFELLCELLQVFPVQRVNKGTVFVKVKNRFILKKWISKLMK